MGDIANDLKIKREKDMANAAGEMLNAKTVRLEDLTGFVLAMNDRLIRQEQKIQNYEYAINGLRKTAR